MLYMLIPLSFLLFCLWQLEKHDNKQLVRHIRILDAIIEISKEDLSDSKWDDIGEDGREYWELN